MSLEAPGQGVRKGRIATAQASVVSLNDKLGGWDIVGVCISRDERETIGIATLLLSCRALGRGIEDAFIRYILMPARNYGCCMVAGTYVKRDSF